MSKKPFLTNITQYLAARGVLGFTHCFETDRILEIGAALGSTIYNKNKKRKQRAHAHIRWSFPEFSETQIAKYAEQSYQHMIQLFLVDSLAAPKLITTDGWPNYVELGDISGVLDLLVRNKPAIMLTGHCGNWEVLGSLLGVLGYPIHALARPIDNPYINRWLMSQREARGAIMIDKFGAMGQVQDIIRRGGHAAFIADQNAGDRGLFVPFFGRLASSYKSIALLAMRYQVPVIAGVARRLGDFFKYRLEGTDIVYPEDWADQPDPVFYITARYNKAIEQMVREAPGQYLWVHRRWKSRPRHERKGEPLPAKLQEKLEALPWMTQQEMDRIIESTELGDNCGAA